MPTAARRLPKSRLRKRIRPPCEICSAHGAETFRFLQRRFVFDVDRAREIADDGRPAWVMCRSDVRFAVDTSRIHDDHVPHVKVRFPGIVARVRFKQDDGRMVEGDVLIDGHHRAAKCLRLRRSFSAYRLSVEETDAVLVKRPDRSRRRK